VPICGRWGGFLGTIERMELSQLRSKIRRGAAQGINRSLNIVLADILLNAPRRSGRLAASYRITQQATAENLRGEVGSSVSYSPRHYPAKPARFSKAPTLFSPTPALSGQPDRRLVAIVTRNIERAITQ
jgi:hypothetical protein